jgi:predicted Zn-dependent protease
VLKKLSFTVILLLILGSCATSPTGRSQLMLMPADQMSAMGIKAFTNLKQKTPIEKDKKINRYVRCVATAITQVVNSKIKKWEVVVFKDKTANAFALPGGKIGVHTGLLKVAKNQDQLAAVIGHEVGHVIAKHGNERVSQQFAVQQGMSLVQALANTQSAKGQMLMQLLGLGAQYGVILPFSRAHESEADQMGLTFMAKAGFNPEESVRLWKNMSSGGSSQQPPEFLSTHPSHETRIARLNKAMPEAKRLYQQAQANGKKPNCK